MKEVSDVERGAQIRGEDENKKRGREDEEEDVIWRTKKMKVLEA